MPDATYEEVLSNVKALSPSDRAKLLEYLNTLLDLGQTTEEVGERQDAVGVGDSLETSKENRNGNP